MRLAGRPLRAGPHRRPGPGRPAPGRLPAGVAAHPRPTRRWRPPSTRSAGPGRGLVNAVLRKVATVVDGGPVRWPDPATRAVLPRLDRRPPGDRPGPGPGPGRAGDHEHAPAEMTERGRRLHPGPGQPAGGRPRRGRRRASGSSTCAQRPAARPPRWPRASAVRGPPPGPAGAGAGAGRGRRRRAGPGAMMAGNVDAASGLGATVAAVVADGRRRPWPPRQLRPGAGRRPVLGPGRAPPAARRPVADPARRRRPPGRGCSGACSTAAAALVRPGGVLVYSVCTLTAAETAGIDRWLAETRPDLVPVAAARPPLDAGRAGRAAAAPERRAPTACSSCALRRVGPVAWTARGPHRPVHPVGRLRRPRRRRSIRSRPRPTGCTSTSWTATSCPT